MKIDNVSQVNSSEVVQASKPASVKPVAKVKTEQPMNVKNKLETDKDIQQVMTDQLLEKSVEQANKALKQYHRRIDRDVHEVTKVVMYKMVDTDTDEVIREFPPKKIQDMIAKMWELAGLFVDEEV